MHKHIAGRPAFLNQTPGIIDALFGVWSKASAGFQHFRTHHRDDKQASPLIADAPHTDAQDTSLPSYILLADEDIVCVEIDQKTHLIEPFCQHNRIEADDLYIPYIHQGYVVIQRDALERLLAEAKVILAAYQGDVEEYVQTAYADELLHKFGFLEASAKPAPSATEAPYKVPASWEAHCQ